MGAETRRQPPFRQDAAEPDRALSRDGCPNLLDKSRTPRDKPVRHRRSGTPGEASKSSSAQARSSFESRYGLVAFTPKTSQDVGNPHMGGTPHFPNAVGPAMSLACEPGCQSTSSHESAVRSVSRPAPFPGKYRQRAIFPPQAPSSSCKEPHGDFRMGYADQPPSIPSLENYNYCRQDAQPILSHATSSLASAFPVPLYHETPPFADCSHLLD